MKKEPKFKIGDVVEVIHCGNGCGPAYIGNIVTIIEVGEYCQQPGYKVTPAIGNSQTGQYNYMIGESTFELITEKEGVYEIY